jgi:SAM-dependent methyltransferase
MQVENCSSRQEPRCPICDLPSSYSAEAPRWGEWRVCDHCGLEFVDPLRLPESAQTLFNGAYRGERHESAFEDFNRNLKRRGALIRYPALGFWTRAYPEVLDWLARRVGRGATVLEVGCGPGFFLHALRQRGFNAVGLDVAQEVVELNRRDGFEVGHGEVETASVGSVKPDAIVAFFMLHHLERPKSFFCAIKERWPDAPLAIAQYGPGRRSPLRSSPPRNLTHWNSNALRVALERSGYTPTVIDLPSSGVEHLSSLRRILKSTVTIPPLFRFGKRVEQRVLPKLLWPLRTEAEAILAFAEPLAPDTPLERKRTAKASAAAQIHNRG